MKVLFICKHNRFRSKVAEAIFNELNNNSEILAESAGLVQEVKHPFVHGNVIKTMSEKGYVVGGKPRKAIPKIWERFDKIVIVADNVNKKDFPDFKGEIEKWEVSDCDVSDVGKIAEIINLIERKVKVLTNNLKN